MGDLPACLLLLLPASHNTALAGVHIQDAFCPLGHAVPIRVVPQPVPAGVKYESKLQASLEEAGLAFWSEEELRSQGFVKTPDARLQVDLAAASATHSAMHACLHRMHQDGLSPDKACQAVQCSVGF